MMSQTMGNTMMNQASLLAIVAPYDRDVSRPVSKPGNEEGAA